MALPAVGQAELLGSLLLRAVSDFKPRALGVFGVAGGNGLERLEAGTVARLVALDFNPSFLSVCTQRHSRRFARYEPVLHDLSQGVPVIEPVELLFAGLLLEYLDCEAFLPQLPQVLRDGGILVTVLQLPSPALPKITVSPYTTLTQLQDVFRFVNPAAMRSTLLDIGFTCCEEEQFRLASGKSFHYASFRLKHIQRASAKIR